MSQEAAPCSVRERSQASGFLFHRDQALRYSRTATEHIRVRTSSCQTPKSVLSPALQQVSGGRGGPFQGVVFLGRPCWGPSKAGLNAELLPTSQMAPLVSVTFYSSQILIHLLAESSLIRTVGVSGLMNLYFPEWFLNALLPEQNHLSVGWWYYPPRQNYQDGCLCCLLISLSAIQARPGSLQCSSFPDPPNSWDLVSGVSPPSAVTPRPHLISMMLPMMTEFTTALKTGPAGR